MLWVAAESEPRQLSVGNRQVEGSREREQFIDKYKQCMSSNNILKHVAALLELG